MCDLPMVNSCSRGDHSARRRSTCTLRGRTRDRSPCSHPRTCKIETQGGEGDGMG